MTQALDHRHEARSFALMARILTSLAHVRDPPVVPRRSAIRGRRSGFGAYRARSRSHGMVFYRVLELAVGHDPVRYRDLVLDPQPRKNPPLAPGGRGHPPSLERPPAHRPWRAA